MDFIYRYDLHYIIRMLVACLCGIAIGFERKNRSKEAGIRTHCIVCLASALMMIISKYAFEDMLTDPTFLGIDIKLDPSRMAQGIVTGVGFLGAGMIFVHRQSIVGLTTAAGIWCTAGIGMAIGSGMYFLGVIATVIMLLVQILFHLNARFLAVPKHKKLTVYGIKEPNFQETAEKCLKEKHLSITNVDISYDPNNDLWDYAFALEMPPAMKEEELCKLFPYKCMLKKL
ncbi:MAG: MgtC/SapB family protein [Clostridia bacterium]|nr:MgtC/SapB family protein [Clostridia bacterium]